MFFGGVLLQFSLYGVAPRSRNCSKTFSACQVSCLGFDLPFLGFSSAIFFSHVFRCFVRGFFVVSYLCFLFFFFPFFPFSLLSLSLFLGLARVSLRLSALCPGRRLPSPGRSGIALHALPLPSCTSLCPGRPPPPSLRSVSLSLYHFLFFSLALFLSFSLSLSPACVGIPLDVSEESPRGGLAADSQEFIATLFFVPSMLALHIIETRTVNAWPIDPLM